MLANTFTLLPHLIKTAATLYNDGIEIYDVADDQLWKMTLDDGEIVQIDHVEHLIDGQDESWFLYLVIDSENDMYPLRIESNQVVNIETFSIVPLILITE